MDFIHKIMSIVLPSVTFLVLLFFLPMFLILKFLNFLKRTINIENLSGKVVLITGASLGIGEVLLWAMKHLAHEYANGGARLALAARREHRPRAVAEKASQLGSPDAIVVRADVSKAEDCKHGLNLLFHGFDAISLLSQESKAAQLRLFETLRAEF
ncbi:hypothetical protein QUC31_007786 [Theobroma cacao]